MFAGTNFVLTLLDLRHESAFFERRPHKNTSPVLGVVDEN